MEIPCKRHARNTLDQWREVARAALICSLYWPVGVLKWKGDEIYLFLFVFASLLLAIPVYQDIRALSYNHSQFPRELAIYREHKRREMIRKEIKQNPNNERFRR